MGVSVGIRIGCHSVSIASGPAPPPPSTHSSMAMDATVVEVVHDEAGHRSVPACVGYDDEKHVVVGHVAQAYWARQPGRVVIGWPLLVLFPNANDHMNANDMNANTNGMNANEEVARQYRKQYGGNIVCSDDGGGWALHMVNNNNNDDDNNSDIVSVEELATAFMSHLLRLVDSASTTSSIDRIVIALPPGAHPDRMAAICASLPCPVSFVADSVALCRSSLFATTTTATSSHRRSLLIDFGYTHTTATILQLSDSIVHVPPTIHAQLSLRENIGRDVDLLILDDLLAAFRQQTRIVDVPVRGRRKLFLILDSLHRTLAASDSAWATVDSLADGIDLNTRIARTRVDRIIQPVLDAILRRLKQWAASVPFFDDIILTGGPSSRPSVKLTTEKHFPRVLIKTTRDPSEAPAIGAVLESSCRSLLPSHTVESHLNLLTRDIKTLPFHIGLVCGIRDVDDDGVDDTEAAEVMEVSVLCSQGTPIPVHKRFEVSMTSSVSHMTIVRIDDQYNNSTNGQCENGSGNSGKSEVVPLCECTVEGKEGDDVILEVSVSENGRPGVSVTHRESTIIVLE